MKVSDLQAMKGARKIVAVVAWDFQIAQIADKAGVDLVSVGDSVGTNLWGQAEGEIMLDELLIVCKAVRRGVKRALVSCDAPAKEQNAAAALRLKDAGADMVKLLASADEVNKTVRSGVPVFAEMHGGDKVPINELVETAKRLEGAGAALIDFRHSGPAAGEAVVRAVKIPVIGGLGGGPWLDGRVRMVNAAIGYGFSNIDKPSDQYANVARITLAALMAYADDVRAARQIKGQRA